MTKTALVTTIIVAVLTCSVHVHFITSACPPFYGAASSGYITVHVDVRIAVMSMVSPSLSSVKFVYEQI